jgi:RNA polymerase sigma factor (sigma-70 family)
MPDTTLQSLLDRRAAFLAFVRRRVESRELAEDILQTAYMRALQAAGSLPTGDLRADESATAWFYSVLRNAVIDHYRRRATESTALSSLASDLGLTGPGATEPSAPHPSTQSFVCGCIEHLLPNLRPAYAEVLREVDLAETPLVEFARRHNLSASNAGVRIHRARAALRQELARCCGACSLHACLDCDCKHPAPA